MLALNYSPIWALPILRPRNELSLFLCFSFSGGAALHLCPVPKEERNFQGWARHGAEEQL